MKKKLFLITNESIYEDENNCFFCDNIDLKSIPECLNKFSEVNVIGRSSNKKRSKMINIDNINISNNILFFLINILKSFKIKDAKYLIVSLSPYTLAATLLLKIFFKKHFIYLRSNGFEEYKAIYGIFGSFVYYVIFKLGIIKAKLIACRKHLLKNNEGFIVNPSQLKDKWFTNIKTQINKKNKFLYVGRLRVEKGIFSLIEMLENTNINLTIVTSEKNKKLKKKYNNIELISYENYEDSIIKFYDEHGIFILPSYTEAHPQVLDEALARSRPVIIFKEIEHVKRDREGVFVCDRNLQSLKDTFEHIKKNYTDILKKIEKNKLPTQKNFINELKIILFKNE